ncbi:MAG: NAD(P)H-dependent oxidoreductase subunit E [Phycisphaerae bacterium]|nr:NAD(P)H-dependent oxidoreductase subunit E [Phycisphaerae bacterium]
MLITERQRMVQDIESWAGQFGNDRSSLMPILQNVQKKYSRISEFSMQAIADRLEIHPVEVYGVVSFYSFLKDEVHGKFVIRLCQTITCDMAGKDRVAKQLENDLGVSFGETTTDGMFTLEYANCLGMCDQGPAMLVNDQVFTCVTPEKVHDIIQGCRQSLTAFAGLRKES